MNTRSKAQVFVRAATGDKRVGIWKCAGVAISHRQHQQHLLPGFHWYAPDRNLLLIKRPIVAGA
jgi:hypothetical protein